eukprot:1189975-Prorocentrum_minimum.AAC.6
MERSHRTRCRARRPDAALMGRVDRAVAVRRAEEEVEKQRALVEELQFIKEKNSEELLSLEQQVRRRSHDSGYPYGSYDSHDSINPYDSCDSHDSDNSYDSDAACAPALHALCRDMVVGRRRRSRREGGPMRLPSLGDRVICPLGAAGRTGGGGEGGGGGTARGPAGGGGAAQPAGARPPPPAVQDSARQCRTIQDSAAHCDGAVGAQKVAICGTVLAHRVGVGWLGALSFRALAVGAPSRPALSCGRVSANRRMRRLKACYYADAMTLLRIGYLISDLLSQGDLTLAKEEAERVKRKATAEAAEAEAAAEAAAAELARARREGEAAAKREVDRATEVRGVANRDTPAPCICSATQSVSLR